MSQTAEQLRIVLANTFKLYFKAHSFHWNVRGPLFHSMHQYFGGLYTQVFAEVDTVAEQIRALGEMAPGSLSELLFPASAPPEATHGIQTVPYHEMHLMTVPYDVAPMIAELIGLNEEVLESLYRAHDAAAEEQHDGVVNFIEGAIDAHAKISWQLKAHLN